MPRHADARVATTGSSPMGPDSPAAELPPDLGPSFQFEGLFPIGTVIHKGIGFNSFMLEIDGSAPDSTDREYTALVAKHAQQLAPPEPGFYANGLNHQQFAELLAAQEFIGVRGGVPDEHTMERNLALYQAHPGPMPLSRILQAGSGAVTCVEASTQMQQFLAGAGWKITYVSGSADLRGIGTGEPHSFTIVSLSDHPDYAAAVVDAANPTYTRRTDGALAVGPYCRPITAAQLQAFNAGSTLVFEDDGGHRAYQAAMFFNGAAPPA